MGSCLAESLVRLLRRGPVVSAGYGGFPAAPLRRNRSCDVKKEDQNVDGQVLSPAHIPMFPRVFRYEKGFDCVEIRPDEDNCNRAGVSVELAEATVTTFNLNCRRRFVRSAAPGFKEDRGASQKAAHKLPQSRDSLSISRSAAPCQEPRRKLEAFLHHGALEISRRPPRAYLQSH